ncbi:MAG: hypothetical protein GY782_06415 [Gammaproteobacteria bacterium]|nr:hypothetical protein [Gammaproteobacteria bacterium]
MGKITRRTLFIAALLIFSHTFAAQTAKTTKKNNTSNVPAPLVIADSRGSCSNPSPNDISFIITASQGQLTSLPNGEYLLKLEGVGPYITYFTRRPCYSSGLAATANLVRAWGVGADSFSKDNPTGVLTAAMIAGVLNKNTSIKVLRFSHPDYNFGNSTMRFVVSPVGQNNQIIIKNTRYRNVALTLN